MRNTNHEVPRTEFEKMLKVEDVDVKTETDIAKVKAYQAAIAKREQEEEERRKKKEERLRREREEKKQQAQSQSAQRQSARSQSTKPQSAQRAPDHARSNARTMQKKKAYKDKALKKHMG